MTKLPRNPTQADLWLQIHDLNNLLYEIRSHADTSAMPGRSHGSATLEDLSTWIKNRIALQSARDESQAAYAKFNRTPWSAYSLASAISAEIRTVEMMVACYGPAVGGRRRPEMLRTDFAEERFVSWRARHERAVAARVLHTIPENSEPVADVDGTFTEACSCGKRCQLRRNTDADSARIGLQRHIERLSLGYEES